MLKASKIIGLPSSKRYRRFIPYEKLQLTVSGMYFLAKMSDIINEMTDLFDVLEISLRKSVRNPLKH